MWEPLTPRPGSKASCSPAAQSRTSVALILSHEPCKSLLLPNHPAPATPFPPFWGSYCLFPIPYSFSASHFGLDLHSLEEEGGCMGRAAAPVSCGGLPWPQPGSRAGLWWVTQGQRVQENMQNSALKRQRRSSLSYLLSSSSRKCENWYAKWMQRNSSSRSWVWEFSPRWSKERCWLLWSSFNWYFLEEEAVWPWDLWVERKKLGPEKGMDLSDMAQILGGTAGLGPSVLGPDWALPLLSRSLEPT